MSIISRISTPHLGDETFAELWTNATAERQPLSHPHLTECAECRLRLASFTSWLDELRVDAVAEAEEAIPAERLANQRSQILRRIEAGERPARVIAFPRQPVETPVAIPARRWMVGVAAACFIAGVGLGQVLDLGSRLLQPVEQPRIVANPGGIVPNVAKASPVNDEADLEELEAAATPRYEALRAYDNFTPRAADFVKTSR
ncbi:MAG: anti-sigma factor [Acidobacteriota bacterium]|nr:anti-sigma factor [Acidobacteriota bacterium]